MDENNLAQWMQSQLTLEGCLYQDDVVDYAIRSKAEHLLRENADGNQVITIKVLNAFKKLNETTVVWVRPDRYWRFRVAEDEDGRNARG